MSTNQTTFMYWTLFKKNYLCLKDFASASVLSGDKDDYVNVCKIYQNYEQITTYKLYFSESPPFVKLYCFVKLPFWTKMALKI